MKTITGNDTNVHMKLRMQQESKQDFSPVSPGVAIRLNSCIIATEVSFSVSLTVFLLFINYARRSISHHVDYYIAVFIVVVTYSSVICSKSKKI